MQFLWCGSLIAASIAQSTKQDALLRLLGGRYWAFCPAGATHNTSLGVKFGMDELSVCPLLHAKMFRFLEPHTPALYQWRWNLARRNGPSLNSSMPNFTPNWCCMSLLWGEKPQYHLLTNLNMTPCFVLCAMLAVIRLIHHKDCCHSVLWHCWLGVGKSIWPVKIKWWGVGVVICLQWGADCLHMVQLMPLHSKTPSSFVSFKSRLVLPFWYQLRKRPLNG